MLASFHSPQPQNPPLLFCWCEIGEIAAYWPSIERARTDKTYGLTWTPVQVAVLILALSVGQNNYLPLTRYVLAHTRNVAGESRIGPSNVSTTNSKRTAWGATLASAWCFLRGAQHTRGQGACLILARAPKHPNRRQRRAPLLSSGRNFGLPWRESDVGRMHGWIEGGCRMHTLGNYVNSAKCCCDMILARWPGLPLHAAREYEVNLRIPCPSPSRQKSISAY